MIQKETLPPILYYFQTEKNNDHLSEAIMHGFGIQHWRPVGDAKCYPGEWIHMMNSLQYGAFQILDECRKTGKNYIFIDNGYINNHTTSDWLKRMYRIVPNAFQHHWIPEIYDVERYTKHFDADISEICRPWNYGRGNHILVIPQSSYQSNKLFGLSGWARNIHTALQSFGYPNKIVFRQKGMYTQPLELDLLNAQACITYSSNVAVDAVRLGIPTFCGDESAARPVADHLKNLYWLHDLVNYCILEPENKIEWLQGLICGQFTHTEISNGFAKEMVLNELVRRLNEQASSQTS